MVFQHVLLYMGPVLTEKLFRLFFESGKNKTNRQFGQPETLPNPPRFNDAERLTCDPLAANIIQASRRDQMLYFFGPNKSKKQLSRNRSIIVNCLFWQGVSTQFDEICLFTKNYNEIWFKNWKKQDVIVFSRPQIHNCWGNFRFGKKLGPKKNMNNYICWV